MKYSASIAFMFATLVGVVGCQTPSPAAKFIQQADRLHREALASTAIVDTSTDLNVNEYVQDVANRIAVAAKTVVPGKVDEAFVARIRCHLVNCDTVNAFTTGGTQLYVTNGLLQQCGSEDDLAAAIAHAYAHAINLDLEAIKIEPDAALPLSMVAWQFVTHRYTREQERRADALGLALFAQAGWDPTRFAVLFERMESISGGNVANDREPLPERAFGMQSAATDVKRGPKRYPVADAKTFEMLRRKAALFHEPPVADVPLIFLRAIPNCILSGDTREQKDAQERLRPLPSSPQPKEPS